MQNIQILIEENAYGAVRPMDVVANAPVAALVPAIVEELQLPRTDLFGNKLVYILRYPSGGPILHDDKSLAESGIRAGSRLTLDSYVLEGSVAALYKSETVRDQPTFYSSQTMVDVDGFPAVGKDTSASLPVVKSRRKGRRWTRRAFLVASGAALGAGGLALGYAAYHSMDFASPLLPAAMHAPATPVHKQAVLAQPAIPTHAIVTLVFSQHQQQVRALAWSPDAKMLASGANDAQVFVWDQAGKVQLRKEQAGAVRAVAWSTDGQQLAVGTANQVQILNPLNGAFLAQLAHIHTDVITTLAWSQRQVQLLVSGALDTKAVVWNTATYTPQTIFTGHTTAIESAAWASDSTTIATSSHGGVVRVWNAESGQQVHGYYMDAQVPMRAVSFASKGEQLSVGGDDGIVRLWNGLVCQNQNQSGFGVQCIDAPQRLHAHQGHVRTLAWSPDARFLATGGDDGILAVWYPNRRQTPLFKITHNAPVMALAWSVDNQLLAAASGNTVTIYRLQ